MDGWIISFLLDPFGMAYFQVRTVSFREGTCHEKFNLWHIQKENRKIQGLEVLGVTLPKQSMRLVRMFTCIYHKNKPNVGKYILHGWYGLESSFLVSNVSDVDIVLSFSKRR